MLVHQAWRLLQQRAAAFVIAGCLVLEEKLPSATEVEVQAGVIVPFVRIVAVRR